MPEPRKTKGVHLTLPLDLYEHLAWYAATAYRSKAAFMKDLIAQHKAKHGK